MIVALGQAGVTPLDAFALSVIFGLYLWSRAFRGAFCGCSTGALRAQPE
jgi:hypothetical protein